MDFTIIIGNRNYSSWSLRGWLVAKKSRATFDTQRVALFSEGFKEKIQKLSPSGLVPALNHQDFAIHDSLAIAEYLAEQYPAAKLWPKRVDLRAIGRAYSCEMHSGFAAIRTEMPMNIRAKNRHIELSEAATQQVSRVFEIWTHCLSIDIGKKRSDEFLLGQFSILDAMYIPIVLRFETYGIAIPSELKGFVKRCLEDADLGEWIALANDETEVLQQMEVGG